MKQVSARADRPLLGILLMTLATLLLALMDTTGKYLTAHHYAVTQILWVRYAVFLALALVQIRGTGLKAAMRSRQPGLQLLRSLVLVAEVAVFLMAFRVLPLITVHSLAAATPLMALALAVPLLGETVGLKRWLAVLAGGIGVLMIIRPGLEIFGGAVYLPLGGAALWALYQILVRRVASDGAGTTVLYTAVTGFVIFGAFMPWDWRTPDLDGWLLLAAVGVFGGSAHSILIKSLQLAPAGVLQPLNYLMVVWSAGLGFLVFGTVPDLWTIAGVAVVAASGLYTLRSRQSSQPPLAVMEDI